MPGVAAWRKASAMVRLLRVASCNTANFNFPGVRFAGRPGGDGAPLTEDVYHAKIEWLSTLIRSQKVDIIGLQELFHKSALETLAEKALVSTRYLFAPDLETNVQTQNETAEARGPFCGIASKYPLSNTSAISEFPANVTDGLRVISDEAVSGDIIPIPLHKFQRPVLRADASIATDSSTVTVTILVAHLKSKRQQFLKTEDPKDPTAQALGSARSLIIRAAEAAALRSIVVELVSGNNRPLILMGDLNDDLTSVTTQLIGGDEPAFFLKLPDKKAIFDALLYSAHEIQEQNSHRSVAFTHVYNGRYELLDHIFLSQEFAHGNPQRIADVRNTRVFNDHLFDARLEGDRSIKTMSTSDHGLPICEIEWRNTVAPQ